MDLLRRLWPQENLHGTKASPSLTEYLRENNATEEVHRE